MKSMFRPIESSKRFEVDDSLRCLTRRSDVRTQVVGDETVVLDERGGQMHQLNHTATFIWHACDGRNSVNDITRLLVNEFDIQEKTAAADVADTIEQLRGLGLLRG